ncbi:MAG: glycine betaine/L-proline ABC transporter ATP-binding protein, partial [Anderseniella sp.]|nr:glycine betaine/L-proline ABC transporter ATP-binding protein [Anderseniella sp.]
VQLCTPEEMVLNPADEYVAEFARNAPRDRIVSAAAIMKKSTAKTPSKVSGACVLASTKIGAIAEQVISSDKPTPVTDADGYVLGHVSRERITKALFGKGEIV